MKIDERKALNTQKPQSEKVYETKADVSARTAKTPSPALQDGVALEGQDQLRALVVHPRAGHPRLPIDHPALNDRAAASSGGMGAAPCSPSGISS